VPIDIYGWVEVTRHDEPERSDEHAWMGAINLGALIDVADRISQRLFGFSGTSVANNIQPVAAGRGLPAHPSQEVEAEIAKIRSLAHRTGQDECGGYTHASWSEIKAAGLGDAELRASGWATVFDLVRSLERDERIGPDRIRFVIYYCV
jgi:hypothetical protein